MINNRQGGRRRGRGGQGQRDQHRGGGQPGNRQDNRQRGNAAQLLEKYKSMARDSQLAGDRVQTEYYLQFADHYFRVLSESRARFEEQNPRRRRDDEMDDDEGDEEMAEAEEAASEEEARRADRQERQTRDRFSRRERRAATCGTAAGTRRAIRQCAASTAAAKPSRSTCFRRQSAATKSTLPKLPTKSRAGPRRRARAPRVRPKATTRSLRPPKSLSCFAVDRARTIVRVERDEGEHAFGDLDLCRAEVAMRDDFDPDAHRRAADTLDLALDRNQVAQMDRRDELHRLDRDRRHRPLRAPRGDDARRDVHLAQHPPAENMAVGVDVGRARARRAGSVPARDRSFLVFLFMTWRRRLIVAARIADEDQGHQPGPDQHRQAHAQCRRDDQAGVNFAGAARDQDDRNPGDHDRQQREQAEDPPEAASIEWRGLGMGSGCGIELPFGRAKWDYQGDKPRVTGAAE